MFYTVYRVTHISSGKVYVGAHKTLDLNDGYLGSGLLIRKAIAKYGPQDFRKEYLAIFTSSEDMFTMEATLVDEVFIAREDTYNLRLGGSGGFDYVNQNLSPEARLRIVKLAYVPHRKSILAKYGVDNINKILGVREKISRAIKQRHADGLMSTEGLLKTHTEETKRKIGLKNAVYQRGVSNSQYGSMWVYNTSTFESKKILKDEPIPEGWVKGRRMKLGGADS